jgi:hypothetical protein
MKQNVLMIIKRIAATMCLFAGMLAMTNTNIEGLISSVNPKEAKVAQIRQAKERLLEKLKTPVVAKTKSPEQAGALRDSLAQDEFGDMNPFADLANVEPLKALFAKGVKRFERTTYRSPNHQGESGYDLLEYQIEHPQGGQSIIMAYLERPVLTATRGVGMIDERIPFVMVVTNEGEKTNYAYYRSGELVEQNNIPWAEAQGLVAQRLNASVPFLSVSR